jgi:hypothetical protein
MEMRVSGNRGPRESETNLAFGILLQALRDLMRPKKSSKEDWQVWQKDALEWLLSEETSPGSFHWVCEILVISPQTFRKGLLALNCSDCEELTEKSKKLSWFYRY